MRRFLLIVLIFAGGCAVGWAAREGQSKSPARTEPVVGDPHWPVGQRMRVGFADPHADVYRSEEVEIVRIVQLDGPTLMTEDGATNAPRVEWKFTFPNRTYFAVPRP
jgi:hypothetical protein